MRVRRVGAPGDAAVRYELWDDDDRPVAPVNDFLAFLGARGCSPNTLAAYAYDLRHFARFLALRGLGYGDFGPPDALELLTYLRRLPSGGRARRLAPVLATTDAGGAATCLAPATVNRILAAVSSFYEYLIVAGHRLGGENPLHTVDDLAAARVAARHQPFLGRAGRQRPVRRFVQVRTIQRLPRPMGVEQVQRLLAACRKRRDRALLLLMLQGGLRPGEALNLRLGDIEYGRRRVTVRHYTDHPRGVRTKSRVERVVDLHEPEALAALSDYVLRERPDDTDSPFVFLVGGRGRRRHEPLSYAALAKWFARTCARLDIRDPWVTPHALRHTHATRLWEGGMRELTLQKRLGHASPESTRRYTRVSDARVVEEYGRALGRGRES